MSLARLNSLAEAALLAQFKALPNLSPQRQAAFARFLQTGLPDKRLEAYHYTDVRGFFENHPVTARRDGVDLQQIEAVTLQKGVSQSFWVLNESHGNWPQDPMVDLNLAFCHGSLVLTVKAGENLSQPIDLSPWQAAFSGGYSRIILRLEAGTKAVFIENYGKDAASSGETPCNNVVFVELGERAHLDHFVNCEISQGAGAFLSLIVDLAAESQFNSLGLNHGFGFQRRQCFIRFRGERAVAHVSGIGLLAKNVESDTTLLVEHQAAHCTSRENFRHIVERDALGVFQGKIIVAPGAQKTDGKMMSRAILLNESAAMLNKPELEIYADDVVCGHGATVGGLDDQQLFYLMARGLKKDEAQTLLLHGFVSELADSITEPFLRDQIDHKIRAWLQQREVG